MTEDCNLRCGFCAYGVADRSARRQADPVEVGRVGRLLARYASATGRPVKLSWLGGEPFLWKPLSELSRALFAQGLLLSTTTNGVPLRSAALRRLVIETFDEVVVSLDGVGRRHDEARSEPGLFDALEATLRALIVEKRAAGSRLQVKVNTILMRDNVGEFAELCERLAGWGVDGLTFNALGGRDRPEYFPDHRLGRDALAEFAAALPALRRRLSSSGLQIYGSGAYLERIACAASDVPVAVADCAPGAWFWAISEQGRISPCGATTAAYGVATTELTEVAHVDALEARFRARRAEQRSKLCDNCACTQHWGKFERAEGVA